MDASPLHTLVVRDRDRVVRAERVDEWDTLTLIGSLSADPRTLDELRRAYLRYRPHESLEDWPWSEGLGSPPTGPWLVIDLAAMRLVAGGGADLPEPLAAYQAEEDAESFAGDGAGAGSSVIWINLPPDWEMVAQGGWEEALVPMPIPREPLDVRGVLFGRALAEGIAREAAARAARGELPTELPPREAIEMRRPLTQAQRELGKRWHRLTVRVHADWLMTPRDDLEGQPPRVFLHRGREWVECEMERRQRQWTREGGPPRPIDPDTYAFRYGPLGRHEVVMYFELCRQLVERAWELLVPTPTLDVAALAESLHQHAAWWMAEGSLDEDSHPPATVIEHERRRMPLVDDGRHFDCDCPLCRMQAEGSFGPAFCCYDGHHLELDEEFAFSLCETRTEWELEQGVFREIADEASGEEGSVKRGQEDEGPEERLVENPLGLGEIWQRSMVDWEAMRDPGLPAEVRSMAVGMRIAELVADLQEAGGDRDLIDRLNGAFDSYRRAATDPPLAAAAQRELADALERLAAVHPKLTAKAADLQSRLEELRLIS